MPTYTYILTGSEPLNAAAAFIEGLPGVNHVYAHSGDRLEITTERDADLLAVRVKDASIGRIVLTQVFDSEEPGAKYLREMHPSGMRVAGYNGRRFAVTLHGGAVAKVWANDSAEAATLLRKLGNIVADVQECE